VRRARQILGQATGPAVVRRVPAGLAARPARTASGLRRLQEPPAVRTCTRAGFVRRHYAGRCGTRESGAGRLDLGLGAHGLSSLSPPAIRRSFDQRDGLDRAAALAASKSPSARCRRGGLTQPPAA
jgi:hypothetical protein